MRPTARVTIGIALSAVALTALAAAGCSTASKPPEETARKATASAKPAAPPASAPVTHGDPAATTTARPIDAGPVSFADAEAVYRERKYGEAAGLFTRFVADRPDSGIGQYMLGLSAWKAGDLATAERAFDAALAIDPHHVRSLMNFARVRIEQERADDAIALLTRAAEIEPASGEVHRLMGRAFRSQGKVDDAMEAYRHAIELDGNDAWALNNLGLILLEQQQADAAVPLLAKAAGLRKDTPVFHNNLGMALEHTGRFRTAAAAYQEALTADAGYERARLNLARVEVAKSFDEEPPAVDTAAKQAAPVEDARVSRHEKTPEQ